MEAAFDIAVAFAIAAAIISLFAILRVAFRSTSLPSWANGLYAGYGCALLLTFAFAGSLFYLALALSAAIPGWVAFFATFAVHIGLVALFLKLLPIDAKAEAPARSKLGTAASEGAAA